MPQLFVKTPEKWLNSSNKEIMSELTDFLPEGKPSVWRKGTVTSKGLKPVGDYTSDMQVLKDCRLVVVVYSAKVPLNFTKGK